ncbi:hypothetical protein R6258_11110 [Halomonas sp. HP20-15]|uniref:MMPL family transporter n=1 Tax=Halomonas sp. HP20-15 TaxID=3085901 RepID=UPI002982A9C1|nr:hypothetical protein [Halomonas sp. HP20-15]MDW5377466.1 hypothetical protein [Halomonas sp. HP20-15]
MASEPHRRLAWLCSRPLAWLWAAILAGCALLLAWQLRDGLPSDTRLTALLPEDRQAPLIERASAQLGQTFENRFVLLLAADDLPEASAALAERLNELPDLARLDWRDVDLADADPSKTLGAYRYRLLTPDLKASIDADGGATLVEAALERLFSPLGSPQPVRDPFGLLERWLNAQDGGRIEAWQGLLTVRDDTGTRRALLIGQLAGSPYALPTQQALSEQLAAFERAHPQAELLHSGLIFHAAAGARQARHEITTIGLGAFTGLIAILLVVFRSPRTLAALLLPLAGGLLFALPLTLALFGRLHLLTLAFGASLIGVAIDYALHLQSDRAIRGPRFRLRPLLPGLALGLASSLVAYLAQALTPLPGLRQMAIFAALGLTGAWLCVVLWLPRLRLPAHPATARLAELLWRVTTPRRRLSPWVALAGVAVMLAIVAGRFEVDDSLRLLNPSSPQRLAEERQVQSLLGSDTGSHYLLVRADDEAALLERLDALGDALDTRIAAGLAIDYDNLAERVPPPAEQQANLERVRRLYDEPLETLVTRAGLPPETLTRARATLDEVPLLRVADWLAMPAGERDRRLWLGHSDAEDGEQAGTLAATLVLSGVDAPGEIAALQRLAAGDDNVEYVDRVARLSALLGELRRHIAGWVAAALAGLMLVLAWRYRARAWRVAAPALGALLGVLTLFAITGTALNVFSQLGMLLVLGIGLDAGIFSAEHARRPATWLAITLSTLTSVLAFGLLAFSATPALHHLGLTCLIGLTLVWLLVPWVRPADATTRQESAHD